MDKYNDANRMVAILCNHQKSVSSAGQATIEAATAKIVLLKEQKKVLKGILKLVYVTNKAEERETNVLFGGAREKDLSKALG